MVKLSRTSFKFFATFFAVVLLAACARERPILNITNSEFPAAVSQKLSLDEVAQAISRAGKGRQDEWSYTRQSDNLMIAEINVRQHYAKVEIEFTTQKFSITYADSKVLRYDGEMIHRKYNSWVTHLADDIRVSAQQAAALK